MVRQLTWLVALALASSACDETPAPRTPAPQKPQQTQAPLQQEPEAGESPILDAFGNLKGSDERVLGFELPAGAKLPPAGRGARIIETSEERLLRFYTSRGHEIVDGPRGKVVTHTERTLRNLPKSEAKEFGTSILYLHPGPGSAFTLVFAPGTSQVKPPPLMELMDQERKATEPAQDAEPAEPDDEAKARPMAPGAVRYVPTDSPKLKAHDLKRLRKRAFDRAVDTRRARDMSEKVYEWSKKGGGRQFVD